MGTFTIVAVPTQVGTDTWREVATRINTSCGIRTDRTLWCWGANDQGQVTGTVGPLEAQPKLLSSDTVWDKVEVGEAHARAIKTDGSLWCWGANYVGERGDGLSWRASYGPVAGP